MSQFRSGNLTVRNMYFGIEAGGHHNSGFSAHFILAPIQASLEAFRLTPPNWCLCPMVFKGAPPLRFGHLLIHMTPWVFVPSGVSSPIEQKDVIISVLSS